MILESLQIAMILDYGLKLSWTHLTDQCAGKATFIFVIMLNNIIWEKGPFVDNDTIFMPK